MEEKNKKIEFFDGIWYSSRLKMKVYSKCIILCSLAVIGIAGIVLGITMAAVKLTSPDGKGGVQNPALIRLAEGTLTDAELEIPSDEGSLSYISYRIKEGDMIEAYEEACLVGPTDHIVQALGRKHSFIVFSVSVRLIGHVILGPSPDILGVVGGVIGVVGVLCKEIHMHHLLEAEGHIGAGLIAKGDGADVVVGDAVFRAGQGNEVFVGQVRVIHQYVVVGISYNGIALGHIDLFHFLGGKVAVADHGVGVHVGLVVRGILG